LAGSTPDQIKKWVRRGEYPQPIPSWLKNLYSVPEKLPMWWSGFFLGNSKNPELTPEEREKSRIQEDQLKAALSKYDRYADAYLKHLDHHMHKISLPKYCTMKDYFVDSHSELFTKVGVQVLKDRGGRPLFFLGWDRCDGSKWMRTRKQFVCVDKGWQNNLEDKAFYDMEVPNLARAGMLKDLKIVLADAANRDGALEHCQAVVQALNGHSVLINHPKQKLTWQKACDEYAGSGSSDSTSDKIDEEEAN